MAFLVEDGDGIENANSYATEAFFRAYFADRGTDVTALTQSEVETALVRATDYIDKRFGRKFRGWKETGDQGLEWPRIDAYDNDDYPYQGIPKNLLHATCEYALRAHTLGLLAPDPALPFATRDATGDGSSASAGQVQKTRTKVGPIEEELELANTDAVTNRTASGSTLVEGSLIPAYPAADLLIEELLKNQVSRDLVRG